MNKIKNILRWCKKHFWKIIASVSTVCLVIIATAIIMAYLSVQESSQLSEDISFGYHKLYIPYIFNNKTGETIIDNVQRYYLPLDHDSIAVYEKDGKKGLFNYMSAEVITEPDFDAAWVFNKGIGGVAVNDYVYFVDKKGNPISDVRIPRDLRLTYIFYEDYLPVNTGDRWGLLDTKGNWVIEPNYYLVERNGEFWTALTDRECKIYDKDVKEIITINENSVVHDSLINENGISPLDNRLFQCIASVYDNYYQRKTQSKE